MPTQIERGHAALADLRQACVKLKGSDAIRRGHLERHPRRGRRPCCCLSAVGVPSGGMDVVTNFMWPHGRHDPDVFSAKQ